MPLEEDVVAGVFGRKMRQSRPENLRPATVYACRHKVQVPISSPRQALLDACPECRYDYAFMEAVRADQGPWHASSDGRSLHSDDFTHDVRIDVHGDFSSDTQRYGYASLLAQQLNSSIMTEYAETASSQLELFRLEL